MPPLPTSPASWTTYPVSGIWFRAIQLAFWSPITPLTTAHTPGSTTRFGPGAKTSSWRSATPKFPLLYLAENPMVALFEVGSLLGSPYIASGIIAHPRTSWVTITVTVNLRTVVDLTDAAELGLIDSNAQEMTGDWFGYSVRSALTSVAPVPGLAPTQELGIELNNLPSVEGFYAISAKVPTAKNLIIFPDKLRTGSTITFVDPATAASHVIRGTLP